MGLCLFAPRLLQDHHADPSTALGWLTFAAVLLWVVARPARPPATSLAVGLAATALAGAAVLPLRVSIPARPESPSATTLIARPGATGGAPPLLFVGLDGGNWETLEPMLAR